VNGSKNQNLSLHAQSDAASEALACDCIIGSFFAVKVTKTASEHTSQTDDRKEQHVKEYNCHSCSSRVCLAACVCVSTERALAGCQVALRKQLNEGLVARDGPKLSVNDFVIKASALVRVPGMPCGP
jgi:hypothetical protein